jgi:hypothetical protein
VTRCRELLAEVEACEGGFDDWRKFADAVVALLTHLFVPPLREPYVEYDTSTVTGTDRRDVIFANRNTNAAAGPWGYLRFELNAKLIVVELKNTAADKRAVEQTVSYMRPEMGQLALICSREPPNEPAVVKRDQQYNDNPNKPIVLFVGLPELREMCDRLERELDPGDLIVDMVERFYMQRG